MTQLDISRNEDLSEAPLSAADMGELLATFSEVTSRLERTHDMLHAEVARLKEELQAANLQVQRSRRLAALGQMAAGIAHEVRNPLGSMQLYASMLIEDLEDRPEEQDIARKINTSVHRLDEIVNDVLTFSSEIKIRAVPVSAGELIESAMESCREPLHRIQQDYDCEVVISGAADGQDLVVECDPGLIVQALVNVVRNAAEAIAAVGVRDSNLRHRLAIHASRDEGMIVFDVSDTGEGIDDEALDRIFNPFFTTRHTGTGLGLAIVHRVIEAHGGETRVFVRESDSGAEDESGGVGGGGGTTVRLQVPEGRSDKGGRDEQVTEEKETVGRA